MVLLPKVGHPSTVKDLCPVTLLNTDVKIFSRIQTNRLEPLQSRILDPMQVQSGAERNMYGALVDLRDTIAMVELAEKKDKKAKAALVSVDTLTAVSYFATMTDVLAAGGILGSTGKQLTKEL